MPRLNTKAEPAPMKQFRHNVIRAGLEALYFTGAHRLFGRFSPALAPFSCCIRYGRGATPSSSPTIISRSRPTSCAPRWRTFAARSIDIVTLDEMHRRLTERDFARRFACLTLDDGYRDNRDFALPRAA